MPVNRIGPYTSYDPFLYVSRQDFELEALLWKLKGKPVRICFTSNTMGQKKEVSGILESYIVVNQRVRHNGTYNIITLNLSTAKNLIFIDGTRNELDRVSNARGLIKSVQRIDN